MRSIRRRANTAAMPDAEQPPSELLQQLVALNERPHAHGSPVPTPTPVHTATHRLLTDMCICCAVLFAGKPGKQCGPVPIWEFGSPPNEHGIKCNTVAYQVTHTTDGAALGARHVGDYEDRWCPQPSPDLIAAEAELLPDGELFELGVPPSPPPVPCCNGEFCMSNEEANEAENAVCDSCDTCMRSLISLTMKDSTKKEACHRLYDNIKGKPCVFSTSVLALKICGETH